MASGENELDEKKKKALELHLLGVDIGHSISPPLHNYICKSLSLPWTFKATECPTIEDCIAILGSPDLAGAVVTMPWKGSILKYLDDFDETVRTLKVCNSVHVRQDGTLCGANTDWVGIQGALRAGLQNAAGGNTSVLSKGWKTALMIGAGGAARAAVYALTAGFGVCETYVLNRDDAEVERLVEDCKSMGASLMHLKTVEQANGLETPAYVISTVPDFEPVTEAEGTIWTLLTSFLSRDEKGVVLDMCYHPRLTRHLQLAEEYRWLTVQGTEVVGHQVKALWRLWVDDETVERADWKGMWKYLREEKER